MDLLVNIKDLQIEKALFVFALESEAAGEFDGFNKLICGIGKVNAAYQLTKAIYDKRPGLIVNLGSAGSSFFDQGAVVCCTQFVQRDMDVRALGYQPYQTPFAEHPVILEYGTSLGFLPKAVCGTGDNFEMGHHATVYNVVDMEAFALALVAKRENIPFLCLKYISDGADGAAAADWSKQVHLAANAYRKILFPKG